MVNLNKEEYVYLIIIHTQNKTGNIIGVNVCLFKTEKDIKRAMLNIISNNARSYKAGITRITYDNKNIVNTGIVSSARIEFNSGIAKTYEAVCCHIEKVNYSASSSKGGE